MQERHKHIPDTGNECFVQNCDIFQLLHVNLYWSLHTKAVQNIVPQSVLLVLLCSIQENCTLRKIYCYDQLNNLHQQLELSTTWGYLLSFRGKANCNDWRDHLEELASPQPKLLPVEYHGVRVYIYCVWDTDNSIWTLAFNGINRLWLCFYLITKSAD